MSTALAYIASGRTITVHDAVASLPVPTAYDGGVALAGLATGRTPPEGRATVTALPVSAILRVRTTDAAVTMLGPVEVLAGANGAYDSVGQLNGGQPILLSPQSGFSVRLALGGDWERVRVTSPGISGGTVTITLTEEVGE